MLGKLLTLGVAAGAAYLYKNPQARQKAKQFFDQNIQPTLEQLQNRAKQQTQSSGTSDPTFRQEPWGNSGTLPEDPTGRNPVTRNPLAD